MRIGRLGGALPLILMTALILVVGAYATVRQDAFLTSFNLNNLLLLAMPLALVTLGQTCALLVGGFDVSVAALMEPARPPLIPVARPSISSSSFCGSTPTASACPCPRYVAATRSRSSRTLATPVAIASCPE